MPRRIRTFADFVISRLVGDAGHSFVRLGIRMQGREDAETLCQSANAVYFDTNNLIAAIFMAAWTSNVFAINRVLKRSKDRAAYLVDRNAFYNCAHKCAANGVSVHVPECCGTPTTCDQVGRGMLALYTRSRVTHRRRSRLRRARFALLTTESSTCNYAESLVKLEDRQDLALDVKKDLTLDNKRRWKEDYLLTFGAHHPDFEVPGSAQSSQSRSGFSNVAK